MVFRQDNLLTSPKDQEVLISRANQWTGFFVIGASIMKELKCGNFCIIP